MTAARRHRRVGGPAPTTRVRWMMRLSQMRPDKYLRKFDDRATSPRSIWSQRAWAAEVHYHGGLGLRALASGAALIGVGFGAAISNQP